MHRFRKKSDAKRAQVPDTLLSGNPSSQQPTLANQPTNTPGTLPSLPPASDFRTSLILPSLSKRFTLLRSSNGDPISLNDVRSKFAEQRARGAEYQVSEEEEEMIVEALGEIQTASTAGSHSFIPSTPGNTAAAFSPSSDGMFATQQDLSRHHSVGGDMDSSASIISGFTPSIASSPSSVYPRSTVSTSSTSHSSSLPRYSSRRHSNNLFGSGRYHDTSYIRSVSKASVGTNRSTTSLAPSDSHGGSVRSAHSARDVEVVSSQAFMPDADSNGDPATASDKVSSVKAWPVSSLSAIPLRLSKEFSLQQVRRTSLALEEVIRGIEEEAEETIVVPRTSSSRAGAFNSTTQFTKPVETPSSASTPIPWMTDEARVDDRDEDELAPSATVHASVPATSPSPSPSPYPRPGTTSPTPRLPGYIPGMTRPLTPRDVDSDDGATGYSTTPRARSPAQSHHSPQSIHSHSLPFSVSRHHHHSSLSSEGQSILPPSILRSSRGSTQGSPFRTTSPGLSGRSRGSSTSSPQAPSPVPSPILDERNKSDILARRPLSPLVGTAGSSGYGGSRPGTPSSGGPWPTNSPLSQMHTIPPTASHENDQPRPDTEQQGRAASFVNDNPTHKDTAPETNSSDSPAFGAWGHSRNSIQSFNGTVNSNGHVAVPRDSSISSIDLGQSLNIRPSATAAKIAARAPTPVHTHPRSPTLHESGNGHDPILLNRSVSKRSQKRMTPPPHIQAHTHTSLALQTPSSSSNSSSNVNLNLYSNTSPLFSPMLNTSASSLLSAGSSYHSWEHDNAKKSGWDQLVEYDSQRSAWQDLLNSGSVGANETDDASETEGMGNPEQVLHSLTGLTTSDLAALQKKLVADALPRKGSEPPRSPTRRRRISTSRASLSVAQSGRESGTNSPAPPPRQATPVTDNATPPSPSESTSRANALLDSVLNSIQSQSTSSTPLSSTPASSDIPSAEPSSLADDGITSKLSNVSSNGAESRDEVTSALRYKALAEALAENGESPGVGIDQTKSDDVTSDHAQSQEEDSGEGTEVPIYQSWRNPSVPLPSSNSVQLVRDVSRKAAAATAALKNSSQPNLGEPDLTIRRRPMKRIDLQQIGSPQLVSSSTSVNAIPIAQSPSPQAMPATSDNRSSFKLSQRFKKLRGTLLTKPPSRDGSEVTPFVLPSPTTASSMPLQRLNSPLAPAQTLVYTQDHVPPASATEQSRFKVPVPSPPASAGPGLKGFMARFRKSRKDPGKETGKEPVTSPRDRLGYRSPDSTISVSPTQERLRQGLPTSPSSTVMSRRSEDYIPASSRARSPTPDPATVNQLFNAATQLGLDRRALDELLARSTSTSSRSTTWTQGSTPAFANTSLSSTAGKPAPRAREDKSLDRARTPDQLHKPPARPSVIANRHPDGEIVRRTIIFAGDNPSAADLNGLIRKDSTSGRPPPSSSATSIHSTGSGAREPPVPVPRLPAGLGRSHSNKPSDSSSYCDMYSQDPSYSNIPNGSAERPSSASPENTPSVEEHDQGPALEVLHLSNGQVIWSVLDSLRAEDNDDTGSLFRRSLASSRGNDANDDMEVRFKEHKRLDSKGSNYSQGSHNSRRRQPVPSGHRPETKLFKTNSSTIGRLIEDLSRNMDSGSFNFMRSATATPSSFHSDASGPSSQVERDLEALLDLINPRPAS